MPHTIVPSDVHCGVGGACAVVKVQWWAVWLRTVEVDNRHNGGCPSKHLLASKVKGTGSWFKNDVGWFLTKCISYVWVAKSTISLEN